MALCRVLDCLYSGSTDFLGFLIYTPNLRLSYAYAEPGVSRSFAQSLYHFVYNFTSNIHQDVSQQLAAYNVRLFPKALGLEKFLYRNCML
jgi:hypothetical protein